MKSLIALLILESAFAISIIEDKATAIKSDVTSQKTADALDQHNINEQIVS